MPVLLILEVVLASVLGIDGASLVAGKGWTYERSFPTRRVVASGVGTIQVLGSVGLLLPSALGLSIGITVASAIGLTVLLIGRAIFHSRSRDNIALAMDLMLTVLLVVVAWGRSSEALSCFVVCAGS